MEGTMFDMTTDERDYLVETLEAAHTQLLHELHHVHRSQFRDLLRSRVNLNERLMERLSVETEARAS